MRRFVFFLVVVLVAVATMFAQHTAPIHQSPANNSLFPGLGPLAVQFVCQGSPGAISHQFQLDKLNVGWQHYANIPNTQTSITASGLTNDTYRWRFGAIFGVGDTSWAGYWYLIENPLPVQLTSFTGTVVNTTSVRLNWMTVSETNNYGFDVQRRPVGTTDWTLLGFVPGNGTTLQRHDYTLTDNTVTSGSWQYRLVQIDLDGTRHEIDPITITMGPTSVTESVPLEFTLEQNYPNPFNPSTTIRFTVPVTGPVTLKVYDLVGREVAMLADEIMQAGTRELSFDASGLASGVYVYRLQSGGNVATQRMVLMK